MSKPLVSICCITYNHAPFIRKCLEGFLMQKDVDYEILIHDDCSTDGTTEIVREYEAKHPDIIKPIYETENQYQKVGTSGIDMFNYRRAQGKYIAYCEGDDYWTNPLKLKKQVDFMEANPEYSVCFTTFRNHVVKTDEYIETEPTKLLQTNGNPDGMDIDLDLFFKRWYTQPMTMLFRVSAFNFDWHKQYKHYRDQCEIYHLMKVGKCRLINLDSGVRNMHSGGISSLISTKQQFQVSETVAYELYKYHHDQFTKHNYYHTISWILSYTPRFSWNRLKYSIILFSLDWNPWHLFKNLIRETLNYKLDWRETIKKIS